LEKFKNIDEYIRQFPVDKREKLESIRTAIKQSAPDAEEAIKYGIPTFVYNGNLVHFAAFKEHIGFYPTSSGIRAFTKELYKYELSKGTVRFPADKPLPIGLIKKIVRFRVKENQKKKNK
jgi:uncharacterized protein YdhG (YjbR/CyaY superfamily)